MGVRPESRSGWNALAPLAPTASATRPRSLSGLPSTSTTFAASIPRALLAHAGPSVRSAVLREAWGGELRTAPADTPNEPFLMVTLPLYDPGTGARRGTLEAELAAGTLFGGAVATAAAGVVLGAFDAQSGASLTSFPFDARLLAAERFTWGGEQWLVLRRPVREPPLVLAAAAPLAQFTGPFEVAARRGLLLIALISLSALALAALLTDRVTRLRERADERALAAVGEFAATLAHEVRNPLTAIRLDLQYVEGRLPPGSPCGRRRRARSARSCGSTPAWAAPSRSRAEPTSSGRGWT